MMLLVAPGGGKGWPLSLLCFLSAAIFFYISSLIWARASRKNCSTSLLWSRMTWDRALTFLSSPFLLLMISLKSTTIRFQSYLWSLLSGPWLSDHADTWLAPFPFRSLQLSGQETSLTPESCFWVSWSFSTDSFLSRRISLLSPATACRLSWPLCFPQATSTSPSS